MGANKLPQGRFLGRAHARREVGDLVLVESHHAAGSRLPRHSHEHAYFCLNFGGSYSESYGRRRRDCRMGMLVFHPPDDRDSALAIEGLTFEILAASARRKQTVDRRAPRWLRDAGDLLSTHVEVVSLRTMAAQAGVHPVHFAATFRRFLGCSLGEYQRRRRFEYARQKLADRTMSVAQVAALAGFADQSHLTRTFKRFSGMTPSDYRTFLGFKTRR